MDLKNKLEYYYKTFDITKISPDPLEFPKKFTKKEDIEISALISSLFAYGNVKLIMRILNEIHSIMGISPYKFILNFSENKFPSEIKYRFYSNSDIKTLFLVLKEIYCKYGSFEKYFIDGVKNKSNLKEIISINSKRLNELFLHFGNHSHGLKFMFPDPKRGSACKRMNLFLRWMVRKDSLDFGIWKSIDKKDLIIPLDTHIAKISKSLGLTDKKNSNWLMAEDITNKLKKYDENDPVKYDFALCHIGMRKLNF